MSREVHVPFYERLGVQFPRPTHRVRPHPAPVAMRPGQSAMPLEPGTTLGPYSVTAKIGEGGLGEVCRARDTKLDRDVALEPVR